MQKTIKSLYKLPESHHALLLMLCKQCLQNLYHMRKHSESTFFLSMRVKDTLCLFGRGVFEKNNYFICSAITAAVWMAACLLNFKLLLQNAVCARALINDLLDLDSGSAGPLNTKASFDNSTSPVTRGILVVQ